MSANRHLNSRRQKSISALVLFIGLFCIADSAKADQEGDWTYTSDGTNVTITGYRGTNENLIIPDVISNMPVVAIGIAAFNPRMIIGGEVPTIPICVTIPQSVTNIGDYAFYYCPLVSVTLSEGIGRIGNYAFTMCSLTNIVIPDSVFSMGQCAYLGCDSLTGITLGIGLRTIGEGAFASTAISSITIPSNVVSIARGTFSNCSNLTNVATSEGLISIGDSAFHNCLKLVAVSLGDKLTTVGDDAFDFCTSLSDIMIPTNLVHIGNGSFYSNASLASINIPDSVTNIGWAAFAYCASLTNIHIGSGATTIYGFAFNHCPLLTSITVSEENPLITSLDGVVFSKDLIWLLQYPEGRSGSYTVPQGIKKIGFEAFSFSIGLTNIIFPDSVMLLFDLAIDDCPNLTSVVFKGDQPEIRSVDLNTSPNLTVYYYPWTSGWTDTYGGRPTQVNPAYSQWLSNYGFTTSLTNDNDNDGMLNWQEYLAGTSPTNKADALAITSVNGTNSSQISWLAKSNISYQVMMSSDLKDAWANAVSGTGTNQQSFLTAPMDGMLHYADPNYAGSTNAFYRVNVVP